MFYQAKTPKVFGIKTVNFFFFYYLDQILLKHNFPSKTNLHGKIARVFMFCTVFGKTVLFGVELTWNLRAKNSSAII